MRIAHFSDLHVLDLEGVSPLRFLNKRLTGWANLRFKRKAKHRTSYVRAVAREVRRAGVQHVAITGDLTNLALETEFAAVRALLEEEMGFSPRDVSVVPGNHDLYTRGARRSGRFAAFFHRYTECDLGVAVAAGGGRFPFVKLRGPTAIIGLSSAVPRPPFVASGVLGRAQLGALGAALSHPEVRSRTPIVLVHHPVHNPPSRLKTFVEGLWDAAALEARLSHVREGLVLHGHLHARAQRPLATRAGRILSVGATSASLHHDEPHRMAGFNVYEVDDRSGDVRSVEAHVYDPEREGFAVREVPERDAWLHR
jgi:3',5'-cyclic AMP phosphodiesterase CpdA